MSALVIPLRIGDVTPRWVSAALAASFPGAEITNVTAEELHDGTALTCRLHLSYAPGGVPGPTTVCLKAGAEGAHRTMVFASGLFAKEAMVYRDVLPHIAANVPRCFAAALDAERGHGFVLLEDLGPAGAAFCGAETPWTIEQCASALRQLAALHAVRWGDSELGDPRWRHRGYGLGETDPLFQGMLGLVPRVLETPHGGALARCFQDPAVVGPALARLRALDHVSATGLIHGDAHVGNFYLDARGEAGMVDFQCVQRGHYTHDVAMIVGSSLDPVDRRAAERSLIEGYLGELAALGVEPPSFDDAWLGYCRHLLYGLFVWLVTTEQFQTELRLVTTVFRFGVAALDHDSLGAIATD
jgi:hypothetical protein